MPLAPAQPQLAEQHSQALLVHRAAIQRHGQRHVLHHVEHRDQVVELIDQPHFAPSEHRKLLVGGAVDIHAVHEHGARGGAIHPTDEVQECRFARPRRPHDGHEFALRHRERHIVERACGGIAFAVDLGQMADGQDVHLIRLSILASSWDRVWLRRIAQA